MNHHFTYDELEIYLKNKRSNTLFSEQIIKYKDHLDNCKDCWSIWNKVRWDACQGSQGLLELKEFLGHQFIEYYDSSWALAARWNELNPTSAVEVEQFYQTAQEYLYNLVIWHESGDREYLSTELQNLVKKFEIKSVIDYGCGVGTDGLFLLEKGFSVEFVDFLCPSANFLNWRLKKRNLIANFSNVKSIAVLPKSDMFWAIDVLEHMLDPLEVVHKLDSSTRLFVHRSQFNDKAGGRHPCHFNFNEIRLSRALIRKGFTHFPWSKLSVWVKNSL